MENEKELKGILKTSAEGSVPQNFEKFVKTFTNSCLLTNQNAHE